MTFGDSRFGLAVIQALRWRSDGWVDRDRFVVSDAIWAKVASLLPGKASDAGVTAKDNRLFLEAVLWRLRTGVPWRALPGEFGKANSVFQRLRRWAKAGVFERVFAHLSGEPDFECALTDGTIVPVHQKASALPHLICS